MTLPPLANLFVFGAADPALMKRVEEQLRNEDTFQFVGRRGRWLAAAAPLPEGPPSAPWRDVAPEFLFAEGEDQAVGAARPEYWAANFAAAPERLCDAAGDAGLVHLGDELATVVRSAGGLVPFYVRAEGDVCAIATRLTDLVRYTSGRWSIDPLVSAIWVSGLPLFPNGRSFVKEAIVVPPGHVVGVRPGNVSAPSAYWDPRPTEILPPSEEREREHTHQLRSQLLEHLARNLDPVGANLATVSGGVDSSVLAGLAGGTLSLPVARLTFYPPDPVVKARNRYYVEVLSSRVPFVQAWDHELSARSNLELIEEAPEVVFPVIHPALGALPRITREMKVTTLFGGELADELFGSGVTAPDWARHTPLSVLLSRRPTRRDVLRWARWRMRWLQPHMRPIFPAALLTEVHDHLQEEYEEWLIEAFRRARADPRPFPHLSFRLLLDGYVAMNWEAASALGIRRVFPFSARNLIELAYSCHPAEHFGPGTKRILRRAVIHDVPPENLGRSDKGIDRSSPAFSAVGMPPLPAEGELVFREQGGTGGPPTLRAFARFVACLRKEEAVAGGRD